MLIEHHIFGCERIHILELIGHARAARGFDAQTHAYALATLGERFLNVLGGSFGEGNHGHIFWDGQ